MKIQKLITAAMAAVAVCGLISSAAVAAPYTAGSLLLGFHASAGQGSTTDYIINLGLASTFRDAAPGFTLGNYGTDLSNTFGSNWFTRTDLYWGAIGIRASTGRNNSTGPAVNGDPDGTLYATYSQGTASAGITSANTNFAGMANTFSGLAASPNDSNASFSTSAQNPSQIWTNSNPFGGLSFGGNLPELQYSLSSGNTIDVYRYLSTTTGNTYGNANAGDPTFVNTISITSSGAVTAVPEPSTYALIGIGALGLFLTVLRRKSTNV